MQMWVTLIVLVIFIGLFIRYQMHEDFKKKYKKEIEISKELDAFLQKRKEDKFGDRNRVKGEANRKT